MEMPANFTYVPYNLDFLSLPAECRVDWGSNETKAILNLNRVYGMIYSLGEDVEDSESAQEQINKAINIFWGEHGEDLTIPDWTETYCWEMAWKYWKNWI